MVHRSSKKAINLCLGIICILFLSGLGFLGIQFAARSGRLPPESRLLRLARPKRQSPPSLDPLPRGLGLGLVAGGELSALQASLAAMGIELEVTGGSGEFQLAQAAGLRLQARRGVIETFTADLAGMQEEKAWWPWLSRIAKDGYSAELELEAMGAAESSEERIFWSHLPAEIPDGDLVLHPSFALVFRNGKLAEFKGGLAIGVAQGASITGWSEERSESPQP